MKSELVSLIGKDYEDIKFNLIELESAGLISITDSAARKTLISIYLENPAFAYFPQKEYDRRNAKIGKLWDTIKMFSSAILGALAVKIIELFWK